jgi:hypothetical protein
MNIESLNVCEIGALYLLKVHAKKGILEITTREMPELFKVSRETSCKLVGGLEKAGFLTTQRTCGNKGKVKIFIRNGLNFRPLNQSNGLNFRQLEKQPGGAVCIGKNGRKTNEILEQKNNVKAKKTSFPLNNPLTNYNYNLTTNKTKTTTAICAGARNNNNNNLLFKDLKPGFPCFDKAGALAEIVVDFFNYRKKDLKKPIKTQRGLDRLISRLQGLSGNNVARAKAICEQSKDHEWQDVFELKAAPVAVKPNKDEQDRQEQKRRAFLDSLIGGK